MAFLYCLSKRKNRPAATKPDDPSSPSSFPLPFLHFLRLAGTHALSSRFAFPAPLLPVPLRTEVASLWGVFVDSGSSEPLYSLVFFAVLHLLLYFCLLLIRVLTHALCGAVHCPVVVVVVVVFAGVGSFLLSGYFLFLIFCFSPFWSLFCSFLLF